MKILIISAEAWRDDTNGGNVLSNIFSSFDSEFAQIYCNPSQPSNSICKKYYQFTDMMMLKSFFKCRDIGITKYFNEYPSEIKNNYCSLINIKESRFTLFFKRFNFQIFYLLKEFAWLIFGLNNKSMFEFVDDFGPDIIFAPCYGSPAMLRLTRKVAKHTGKKVISYISDDHYSLRHLSFSPIFWVNRLWLRRSIRKTFAYYQLTYTMTQEQKNEYEQVLNCNMKILRKGGETKHINLELLNVVSTPIKLVYAGSIYAGRLDTLKTISYALNLINSDRCKIRLDIFTGSKLSKRNKELLNDGFSTHLHGIVSLDQLNYIYQNSDIALHVESFNTRYRLITRLSFSTKIIDCLSSSCAVMALCWEKHSGYIYLKENNAAICIDNIDKVLPTLQKIVDNPELVKYYKKRAYNVCKDNHKPSDIAVMLKNDFCQFSGGLQL